MRTLVCGLDAACPPVLSPMLEAGDLPALRNLVEDGVAGSLESQIPPWTPSAWPSLYTGTNPGKHGVFDFLSFDGYDWEVVNATYVDERPLWELLSSRGFASVVVNVPVTHPPRPFDGALVPGYTAPEHPDCHPPGTLAAIRDAVGDYRVYPREASAFADPLDRYREVVDMRGEAFRYLADRHDPEFGFVQFQQTDTIFHERPCDDEAVRAVYQAVDEAVGTIVRDCDPDTVFLVSDHGMGRYEGYEFRLNEFLRDRGYVRATRGGDGMPTWSTVLEEHLREGEPRGDYRPRRLDRAMAALARTGLTTQRMATFAESVGLARFLRGRLPAGPVEAGAEQVDFRNSTAFVRSPSELGIRVNLRGREPAGVVPPDSYEAVRDELIDLLEDVRTPTGAPVFAAVRRREAFFDGPRTADAVDVVTVPAGFDHAVSARLGRDVFGAPSQPWNHKRQGFLAISGEAVDATASAASGHILDVAPTVLATLDVPADQRMDGRVLPAVDPVGKRRYPGYEAVEAEPTEDEAVERRLQGLGYL